MLLTIEPLSPGMSMYLRIGRSGKVAFQRNLHRPRGRNPSTSFRTMYVPAHAPRKHGAGRSPGTKCWDSSPGAARDLGTDTVAAPLDRAHERSRGSATTPSARTRTLMDMLMLLPASSRCSRRGAGAAAVGGPLPAVGAHALHVAHVNRTAIVDREPVRIAVFAACGDDGWSHQLFHFG